MATNDTAFERQVPAASVVDHALAGSELSVFWLDDVDRPKHPRLESWVDADLVVVGGGYTGLWTAVLAKRRDPSRRVVLLEGQRIGWAASGRNGGFVDASLTHGAANGRSRWPRDYDRLVRLGEDNLAAFGIDLAELGVDAEFERVGSLDIALEQHQLDWLPQLAEEPGRRLLSQLEARARVDSPVLLGAVYADGAHSALVHPGKLATGLAAAATRLGVELYEHSPATKLRETSAGIEIATREGGVRAAQAALGTNAFPSLLIRNRLMTVPVYDYVLMTEPLTIAQLDSIGWAGREGLSELANQFHYSRLTSDNRILWGGYDAVYYAGGRIRPEHEDAPEHHRKLASHFFSFFPQLEGLRFTHRWAGVIDTSTRFCAFYGTAVSNKVAYAAGFTGLGVGAARFAADVMLDELSGAPTPRTDNALVRERPLPFPPEPVASIGIQATRWALDRADHHEGRRNVLLRTLDALGLGFDS